MRVLKAADGEISDLAFSPDGSAIAAAVKHQCVLLWNLQSPSPFPVRLDAPARYDEYEPKELAFSANGQLLAWLRDGYRYVYDRDTRELASQPFALNRLANEVFQSPDGSRVISLHTFPDDRLIGWRNADGEWVRSWSISTAGQAVQRLTLSADGQLFAMLTRPALEKRFWDYPLRVEVREAATADVRATAEYPSNQPATLLFSPDASQLVGYKDMTLLAWPIPHDLSSLGPPQLIRNNNRKHFTAMAYHPAGRHLYATSNDETVHVFDTQSWERTERFRWQLGNLKAVAVSPDGTLAAAGSDKGDVVIWDLDV